MTKFKKHLYLNLIQQLQQKSFMPFYLYFRMGGPMNIITEDEADTVLKEDPANLKQENERLG